jgi:hypothetical protein
VLAVASAGWVFERSRGPLAVGLLVIAFMPETRDRPLPQ